MQGFFDKLEKAGKGLDESKDIDILLEINFGGTGTYYDGKLDYVSSVSRNLHPDEGSYEVSKLEVSIFNQDSELYTGKWVHENLIGKQAELKLAIGTTTNTEYRGTIKEYGYIGDLFAISIEDFTRDLWDKQIPPATINKDDLPEDFIELGTPIPWIYGGFSPGVYAGFAYPYLEYTFGVPALQAGTYTSGTMEFLIAGHPMGTINDFFIDGTQVDTTNWTPHLSGTFHSVLNGTGNVCWLETTQNPTGTSIFHVTCDGLTHNSGLDGTLCQKFDTILLHAVKTLGGLQDDQLGTFEDPGDTVHRYLDSQMSLKDFIDDLTRQSTRGIFYFNKDGKADFVSEGDWTRKLGTVDLTESKIRSFEYNKDYDEMYNRLEYYTYWFPPMQVYSSYITQDAKRPQRETNKTRTLIVKDKWRYPQDSDFTRIYKSDDVDRLLRQFQDAPDKIETSVPMSDVSKVDLNDRIHITYEKAPFAGTGGWIERNLRVVGLEQDYVNKQTIINAWTQGYPFDVLGESGIYHYFKLGDGTKSLYDEFTCKENVIKINTQGTNYAWGTVSDGSNVLFNAGWEELVSESSTNHYEYPFTSPKTNYQFAHFVKPLDLSHENVIYSDTDWSDITKGGCEFAIGTASEIIFRIYLSGPGTQFSWLTFQSTRNLVGTGIWQMVGCAFDRTSTYGKFFYNGSSRGTYFRTPTVRYDRRGSNIYFNGSPKHIGSWYAGEEGDFAIGQLVAPEASQVQAGTLVDYADDAQHRMWRFLKPRYGL